MQVEGNPVTGNHTAHRNAAQPLTSCEGGHAVASGTGSSVSGGERRAAPGGVLSHTVSVALASDDVAILDQLIADLGRDPGYVSPAARAPEKAGTALLESTLVMLDAVLLAEGKDHANWSCLAGMVEDRPAGDARTARGRP
jgi:hypothetical protein